MKRREFLSSLAVGTAATVIASSTLLRGDDEMPSKTKRRIALVGCGWYGTLVLRNLSEVANIEVVSLCDVDTKAIENGQRFVAAFQSTPAKEYRDYRKMLASAKHDVVIVSTPDHWHALIGIAAMKSGADLFLEKPISLDVAEGEALVAAAEKYGRIVQVNTQRRSMPHVLEAKKLIDKGKLGTIGLVNMFSYYHMRSAAKAEPANVPETLDYEMWTGPAPMLPYTSITHPGSWRMFSEYGNGIMGDMCVHMLDMVRFSMNLGWPESISSHGGILVQPESGANISDTQLATFDYGSTLVKWEHRTWGNAEDPSLHWMDQWGATFYGDKGTLLLTSGRYEFTPRGEGETLSMNAVNEDIDKGVKGINAMGLASGPAQRQHWRNFIQSVDTREKAVANIEEAHISTASCILANISNELDRTVSYDPKKRKVTGDAEATRMLRRKYRSPWKHPEIGNV